MALQTTRLLQAAQYSVSQFTQGFKSYKNKKRHGYE